MKTEKIRTLIITLAARIGFRARFVALVAALVCVPLAAIAISPSSTVSAPLEQAVVAPPRTPDVARKERPVPTTPAPPKVTPKPAPKPKPIRVWNSVSMNRTGKKILALLEYYPQKKDIYITSGLRNSWDHHSGRLSWRGSPTAALDIGFGGTGHPAEGRDVARWLEKNFAVNIVELIHTTPYSHDYYIKNGQIVPRGFYGWGTEAQHRDHVHLAMSSASVDKALAKAKRMSG